MFLYFHFPEFSELFYIVYRIIIYIMHSVHHYSVHNIFSTYSVLPFPLPRKIHNSFFRSFTDIRSLLEIKYSFYCRYCILYIGSNNLK